MVKLITKRDAESFYAKAFVICHESNYSAGRTLNISKSDDVSVYFDIRTPHGLLEVSVLREKWIQVLGFSVSMRFVDSPDFYPLIDGLLYDKTTGKWGFPCFQDLGQDGLLEILAERLDWAQDSVSALKAARVLSHDGELLMI